MLKTKNAIIAGATAVSSLLGVGAVAATPAQAEIHVQDVLGLYGGGAPLVSMRVNGDNISYIGINNTGCPVGKEVAVAIRTYAGRTSQWDFSQRVGAYAARKLYSIYPAPGVFVARAESSSISISCGGDSAQRRVHLTLVNS